MNFIEIVETIDLVENKLSDLSGAELNLVTAIIAEGNTAFDVVHHLDFIVEYATSQSDENAKLIVESVDCGKILDIILESARKHPTNTDKYLAEAIASINEIELDVEEIITEEVETPSVTLLSIVTNTLTDILGEATVETLPAEMVFDIVESTKDLEMGEEADKLELTDLIETITENLKVALSDGTIDFDSDDYEGETLSEFLDDYTDLEDLLEEMTQVNEEVLAESTDEAAKTLLLKAKEATTMVEGFVEAPSKDIEAIRESVKKQKAINEAVISEEDVLSVSENAGTEKLRALKSVMKSKICPMV
jgi:hypothetical protein